MKISPESEIYGNSRLWAFGGSEVKNSFINNSDVSSNGNTGIQIFNSRITGSNLFSELGGTNIFDSTINASIISALFSIGIFNSTINTQIMSGEMISIRDAVY